MTGPYRTAPTDPDQIRKLERRIAKLRGAFRVGSLLYFEVPRRLYRFTRNVYLDLHCDVSDCAACQPDRRTTHHGKCP